MKDAKITGVLTNPERQYEESRRMIKLRRGEQRDLRERQLVEGAIALFLDLEGIARRRVSIMIYCIFISIM